MPRHCGHVAVGAELLPGVPGQRRQGRSEIAPAAVEFESHIVCCLQIFIYDALNLQLVTKLKAHNGPVRVIAFNNDGTRLATVSEKVSWRACLFACRCSESLCSMPSTRSGHGDSRVFGAGRAEAAHLPARFAALPCDFSRSRD